MLVGLTMFHLAKRVGLYFGTDLSDAVLEETRRQAEREGHANLRLAALPAHEIDRLGERDFDAVVLNSVVQSFPGHNDLRGVLEKCLALLRPGGVVFLGDVMSQERKGELAAAPARHRRQHPEAPLTTDLGSELFLSREFLTDLAWELPGLASCEITTKIGQLRNELTEYRFDALLRVDPSAPRRTGPGKSRRQDGADALALHPEDPLPLAAGPRDLACAIYTSGTSGPPKGVLVEHAALANLARWYVESNAAGPGTRVAKYANRDFDASLMETLPPLTAGATLCIPRPEDRADLAGGTPSSPRHASTSASCPPAGARS